MPHDSQYPLWAINRAFVAFEAIELAYRAGRGEAPRSRGPQPPRSQSTPQRTPAPLRRIALALMLAAVGAAAAGWAA